MTQPSVFFSMRARKRYVRRLVIRGPLVLCAILGCETQMQTDAPDSAYCATFLVVRRNSHKAWIRSLPYPLTLDHLDSQ